MFECKYFYYTRKFVVSLGIDTSTEKVRIHFSCTIIQIILLLSSFQQYKFITIRNK